MKLTSTNPSSNYEPIQHNVKAIKQNAAECMQTATAQMLSFLEPSVTITVADVIREVPVYEENGEKIGTSPGHLASYIARHGKTTVYTFDVELFDRTWSGLSSEQVVEKLRLRQQYIPSNSWLAKYAHILIDGWDAYAKAGGAFAFEPLSVQLLYKLLEVGPYILMVNSTYLNQSAKQMYHQEKDTFVDNDTQGRSLTHAVTCAGYKDGQFLIVDPDPPKGVDPYRWVAQDHLVASIMSAQTESDNLLISADVINDMVRK